VVPLRQSFIGRQERRTVNQRSSDKESVGRIVMQASKVECVHW